MRLFVWLMVMGGIAIGAQGVGGVEGGVPAPGAAMWIAAGPETEKAAEAMPIFRREFTVKAGLERATLGISGLGQYEAHINGRGVTDAVLTPGWSDYRRRVFYDSYDVTARLRPGSNAVGVLLGNGMFNVKATPGRYTKFTGSMGRPKLIAVLRLRYRGGVVETVGSDGSWRTAAGPVVFSSTYGGEDYDARREPAGWDRTGFDDGAWKSATVVAGPGGVLQAEPISPVKEFARYTARAVTHPRAGVTVYDLGQNMAGWPEIAVQGERGATVTLLAGELLDKNGAVTQRSAHAFPGSQNLFRYTLRGGGVERWHPRFSYYGFRYVQATVLGGRAKLLRLDGRVLHGDVRVDGSFVSSSALLNGIHGLIDKAMLSNLMSVLTDCPHREKLGWLEESHLAGTALLYNFGLRRLYAKISDDMQDAQTADGMVTSIAPEYTVFEGAFRDSPEWGAAVVLTPWAAYRMYGDVAPLREHYASMQRYEAYLRGRLKDGLLSYGLGDWYDIGPGAPGVSKLTTSGVTGTATYYELLRDLSAIARLVGQPEDAAGFDDEAARVKETFNARFFHAQTAQYDTGSQTANAMPLVVGLVPEEQRAAVTANLVADIRQHGNHVTAGDVGFHYVVRALTDEGRSDVLYEMLTRTDKPSYGEQLAHGATTLTEAWDANPESSQNHFMLGHAEEWFYRGLAGIDFDLSRSGLERVKIHPAPVGEMTSAGATYHSVLGTIGSAWTRRGDTVTMQIMVPVAATVVLPEGFVRAGGASGGRSFVVQRGAHRIVLVRQ